MCAGSHCSCSERPYYRRSQGRYRWRTLASVPYTELRNCPWLVTGVRIWHNIMETRKFTFLPCSKSSCPQYWNVILFLYTPLYFPDGGDSEPLKWFFAFKDIVWKCTWLYHSIYMRQTVQNYSFWAQSTVTPCHYAQELKGTLKIRQGMTVNWVWLIDNQLGKFYL